MKAFLLSFSFNLIIKLSSDDVEVSKRFGIDYHELPTLVYFEKKIPNFYQGIPWLFKII